MKIKKYQTIIDYFKDFYDWPKDWMVVDKDLVTGNTLLKLFVPFIESLIKNQLSIKTIKNHLGNLFILGGEIIKRINEGDEKNRKRWIQVISATTL